MLLLFPMFPFLEMPPEDVAVSRKLIRLITHFADIGRPEDPEWKPMDINDPLYMEIGSEFKVKKGMILDQNKAEFWRDLSLYWRHQTRQGTDNGQKREEL